MITRQDVEHVARLARLALSDDEIARMETQLRGILQYVDMLRQIPVEGVEPTSHAVPLVNVMRDDEPRPSLPDDRMVANAPDRVEHLFRVPRIIEE